MSWLDEARQKAAQMQKNDAGTEFSPDTPDGRERLERRLKMMYDNATEREIGKAVDDAIDRFSAPFDEKAFMDFLRAKLED